jgi:RNA polymerase sigma-70 factor, ECF subfamily
VRTGSQGEETTEAAANAATKEFEGFFRQYFPVVARTVALVLHDFESGQDVAQESFARLFVRWKRMESQEHARNFVFRVAINLARSQLRRQRRQMSARSGRADWLPASDEAAALADRVTLTGALGGLSRQQRACLALVDYAGLDIRTAARFLRIRASTVRVHLTRGRRALAEALASTYQEGSTDD